MQRIRKVITCGLASVFTALFMVQSAAGGVYDDVAAW